MGTGSTFVETTMLPKEHDPLSILRSRFYFLDLIMKKVLSIIIIIIIIIIDKNERNSI